MRSEKELIQTITESGYGLRIYKNTMIVREDVYVDYTFGVDNPDREDILKPEISTGDGRNLASIVVHHDRDLSSDDVKELMVSMGCVIRACDVFNEAIKKHLQLEK